MQIRFWVFVNGSPVRMKMTEGQLLVHVEGGRTDEGYSYEHRTWRYDGETVLAESVVDGCDCDGRLTTHYVAECGRGNLDKGNEFEGVTYPLWERVSSGQRDYSAEAMGY